MPILLHKRPAGLEGRLRRAGLRGAGLTMLLLGSSTLALGASLTWNGSTSPNWLTAGNWTPSALPGSGDDVFIDSTGPNTATIGAAGAAAGTLTVGGAPAGNDALVINGAGTLAVSGGWTTIGDYGAGTLTISGGAKLSSASSRIANNAASSGTVTITGAGSQWTTGVLWISADDGAVGRVRVEAGGKLQSSGNVMIGASSVNADGRLTVTGAGSDFSMASAGFSQFIVGVGGKGDFQLLDKATASTRLTYIGGNAGSAGTATVSGGASWTTDNLYVGNVGTGDLTVSGGSKLTTTHTLATTTAGITNGTVTVTGAGSQWKITGVYSNVPLAMGSTSRTSELRILNGGSVVIDSTATNYLAADTRLGSASSKAAITIDGAGSSFTTPYRLYIGEGANSTASVTVSGGGQLNTGYGGIASGSDATDATADTVTVTGANSVWTIHDTLGSPSNALQGLTIGRDGKGVLTIADGGLVRLDTSYPTVSIGGIAGSSGTLNIGAAAGSPAVAPGTLEAASVIFVSSAAAPQAINFNHTAGNYVFAPTITGDGPGAVNVLAGTTVFTAENSYTAPTSISAGATLRLGNGGATGSIRGDVVNDGTLVFDRSQDVPGSYAGVISGSGSVVIDGTGFITMIGSNSYTGGTTINSGELRIGSFSGDGALTGDYVNHARLSVFFNHAPVYAGTISGEGSFEKSGNGTLTLQGVQTYTGGTVVSFGSLILGGNDRLAASGALTVNGGIFNLNGFSQTVGDLSGYGQLAIGTGSLTVGGSANTGFSGAINGSGAFAKQGSGTLTITGNKAFTGTTTVNAGTLQVDGSMAASTFQVNAGGTLRGNGSVGAATVANGGTLAGSAGSTLNMASLTLSGTSNVAVALGAPGATPLFNVTGALTLDGRLIVTDAGGFGSGVYRIIDYGGALTDNGLDVATMPGGTTGSVQTAIANQVNLVVGGSVTPIPAIQFWNGGTTVANGTVNGGSGTWTAAGATNWTDANGAQADVWGGRFAVFQAAPGTVTVDTAGVAATGMQFAVDGYSVDGGPIELDGDTDGEALIRVGNGSLQGAAFRADIASSLSGTSKLVKSDYGTLVLSGDSGGFAGSTSVAAGTLMVNGRLGGALDVLAGGRLQGTGTMGSTTVAENATIAPGAGAIGTLKIAGDITFAAGSTYEVEVDAGGNGDGIAATGKAIIEGGAVQVLAGGGNYAPETIYRIVTANDGLSGTFAGVASNLAFLSPTLTYDTKSAYLHLARNGIDFSSIGGTFNQRSTGGAVEPLGGGNPIYDAVVQMDVDGARSAFDRLSGEIHASAATVLLDDSRFVRDAVGERLRSAFGAAGAAELPVLAYGPGGREIAAPDTGSLAAWGVVFGSWGERASDGNAARLGHSTGGFVTGLDGMAGDNWRLGLLAGYSHAGFDADDRRSSGSSDNYHLGIYGGGMWGAFSLRTGAAYSWHGISTGRTVSFAGFGDRLTADYDAGTAQVFGEVGYEMQAGQVRLEPFAGIAYVGVSTRGFTEKGGGAALTGAGVSTDTALAALGLHAATTFRLDGIEARAGGTVGWRHAFGGTTPLVTQAFAGGNGFAVAGIPVARDTLMLETGLDFTLTPSATLGFAYSGQFGEGAFDHQLKAKLSVGF